MKIKLFQVFLAITLSLSALFSIFAPVVSALDFNEWTEVDLNSHISISESSVTFSALQRGESAYVYKDKGINYFSGNFSNSFTLMMSDYAVYPQINIWALANLVGAFQDGTFDDADILCLILTHSTEPNEFNIAFMETHNGTEHQSGVYTINKDIEYYLTVYRDTSIGTYGTLYCSFYSDIERNILLDTISVALHTIVDYRYIYAIQTMGLGSTNDLGSGYIKDLSMNVLWGSVPDVQTFPEASTSIGATLYGYTEDAKTTQGFQFGITSGVYTANYTGSLFEENPNEFYYFIPTANLTLGEIYYFRAFADNEYGRGYGSEKSFTFFSATYGVYLTGINYLQNITGNSTAIFYVHVVRSSDSTPFADNITARMSANLTWNNPIDLNLISGTSEQWLFQTDVGALLPDTLYYLQGMATKDSVIYYSDIDSILTETYVLPDKPSITITRIEDVSLQYSSDFENYVFEITAKAITSNTTDLFYNEGVMFSQYVSSASALLPPIYKYVSSSDILADNTFIVSLSFSTADWYTGQTLYFQAFLNTINYGDIVSTVVSFTPTGADDDVIVIGGIGDIAPIPIVDDFATIITQIRNNLHLYGVMGTWAFLGLIVLVIALIFGVAIVATPDATLKKMIGIVWGLASVAVLGAFLFTGQLGIWPILIMVGGVVVIVFIFAGTILSGGRANG